MEILHASGEKMIHHVDFITDFIFVENILSPCDIILVLGGSHRQLAQKAAELYQKGLAKYILFSGQKNPNIAEDISEAEWLKAIAVNLGVPAGQILCENKAAHTFENAEFSLNLLEEKSLKFDKVMLVCKAYHSRRSLLTYQYIFPENTKFLVAPTVDKRGLNRESWTMKEEHIGKVMGEVEKIGKYFKDKISITF